MASFALHFVITFAVIASVIQFLYYPKSRRKDYHFTFTLIGMSIFMLVYLMFGVNLNMGVALGLFAIFGIIRYRTESVPIREMTYLFLVIVIATINGLAVEWDVLNCIIVNVLFFCIIWFCESNRIVKHQTFKYIKYDRIELIKPEKREELVADLKERTGLEIIRVEVGSLDFLKDMALLKVYYESNDEEINDTDTLNKMPKLYE